MTPNEGGRTVHGESSEDGAFHLVFSEGVCEQHLRKIMDFGAAVGQEALSSPQASQSIQIIL